MGNGEKRTLEEVLNSLDEKQRKTTQRLQNLIKNIIPESTEIIRHGNITYMLNGRDFIWLIQVSGHVNVEFANGGSLASMLLKTHGTKEANECVRHVEVDNLENVQSELIRLLKHSKMIWLESYSQTST